MRPAVSDLHDTALRAVPADAARNPADPQAVGDPWALPAEARRWIEDHIPPGGVVLELGSGSGSPLLRNYFDRVVSVEHAAGFLWRYPRVEYAFAPLKPVPLSTGAGARRAIPRGGPNPTWYDPDKVKAAVDSAGAYSLLIVDGPPGSSRVGMLSFLEVFGPQLLQAHVLIDDTDRMADAVVARELAVRLGRRVKEHPAPSRGSTKQFSTLSP